MKAHTFYSPLHICGRSILATPFGAACVTASWVCAQVLSIILVAKAMPPRRPRSLPAADANAAKREPSTAGLVAGVDGHGAAAAGAVAGVAAGNGASDKACAASDGGKKTQ